MPTIPAVWRVWLLVFVLVSVAGQLAVGMRASRTASITGDEPFYALTAQSLLSDGDLDLRDEYRGREYREFWDGTVPLWKQMEPAPDGRLLSPHDPGLAILILPAYAIGGLEAAQRFLVLVWASAMATASVVALKTGAPAAAAALAAVAVGAGAPGIVYASQLYPEGPAALAVAIALLLVTAERARPLVLAAVLVALVWLGVKYAPLAAAVSATAVWRWRSERRRLIAGGAVAAVAAAHFAWWHLVTFGGLTPYSANVVWAGETTAAIVADHVAVGERSYRLYGVFLDARFGLLRWLPLAAIAGWGVRRRTLVPTVLIAVSVLMATFVSITIMGWWFPGRMLVATLPALVVVLAFATARLPLVALGLAVWSVLIGVAVAWSSRSGAVRLAVDPWTVGVPLPPAVLFPDFRSFGPSQVVKSVAWAVVLVLPPVLMRRARPLSHQPT